MTRGQACSRRGCNMSNDLPWCRGRGLTRNVLQVDAFIEACEDGDADAVRAYMAAGGDVNTSVDGYPALLCAVMNGHVDIVDLLCRAGAIVGVTDKDGWAAAHWAAVDESGSVRLLRAVVGQYAANPNLQANDGSTPLHVAVSRGCDAAVSYLLTLPHVSTSIRDNLGRLAEDVAMEMGRRDVVALIHQSKRGVLHVRLRIVCVW